MQPFRDRRDAGRQLAQRLDRYSGNPDVIALALPRGGVPVGFEVAARLDAPLDVLVVRKLGVPGHSELAMGAIASGGIQVIDPRVIGVLDISRSDFEAVLDHERAELERREREFRAGRPPLDVTGRIAIVIDDGLATGATMAAAVDALRTRSPARIVVAVPVAPPDACDQLSQRADEVICLLTPRTMWAVGAWYDDFEQIDDDEVRDLLEAARGFGTHVPAMPVSP
jgi:predicted phosphoribosyltransferase